MSRGGTRAFFTLSLILLLTVLCLAQPSAAQTSPTKAALDTFDALHAAAASGANISSLLNEYNSLISQPSPNSSFINLQQQAHSTQQAELSLKSSQQTITFVLVPTIALALAFIIEGLLQLGRGIKRERIREMEIEQK